MGVCEMGGGNMKVGGCLMVGWVCVCGCVGGGKGAV
jgi:hypothetical protein